MGGPYTVSVPSSLCGNCCDGNELITAPCCSSTGGYQGPQAIIMDIGPLTNASSIFDIEYCEDCDSYESTTYQCDLIEGSSGAPNYYYYEGDVWCIGNASIRIDFDCSPPDDDTRDCLIVLRREDGSTGNIYRWFSTFGLGQSTCVGVGYRWCDPTCWPSTGVSVSTFGGIGAHGAYCYRDGSANLTPVWSS